MSMQIQNLKSPYDTHNLKSPYDTHDDQILW